MVSECLERFINSLGVNIAVSIDEDESGNTASAVLLEDVYSWVSDRCRSISNIYNDIVESTDGSMKLLRRENVEGEWVRCQITIQKLPNRTVMIKEKILAKERYEDGRFYLEGVSK